jgi:hypothetical protein
VPAIGLRVRAVDAAPPEVTTNENPVTFSCPVQRGATKVIVLNWSVAPGTFVATLVVTEGAQTVLTQGILAPPSSGAVPLTVAYGKTYVAQLKDALGQPLGQPLIITTTCAGSGGGIEVPPAAACAAVPCITDIAVEPHGTYAQVTVKTSKAANIWIAVSHNAPKPDKSISPVLNLKQSGGYVTEFTADLENLEPGKDAWLLVTAVDQGGTQMNQNAHFKTLRRKVTVTFVTIDVGNDGDDFTAGDGDFFFWFLVNDQCLGMKDYWDSGIGSGESVQPNFQASVLDAPTILKLAVEGLDDDSFGSGKPFLAGCGVAANTSLGDWDIAYGEFQISKSGPGETYQQPFTLPQSFPNNGISFQVSGSFAVSYVP